jgi:hypothetical protein
MAIDARVTQPRPATWFRAVPAFVASLVCMNAHGQEVVVYKDAQFQGESRHLGIGSHRFNAGSNGDFNDVISSIQVPGGLVAILYEEADDGGGFGRSVDLLEDCPDLAKYDRDDKTSYLTVFRATNDQGLLWVRNGIRNGAFVPGHWERPRVGGNPPNAVAPEQRPYQRDYREIHREAPSAPGGFTWRSCGSRSAPVRERESSPATSEPVCMRLHRAAAAPPSPFPDGASVLSV